MTTGSQHHLQVLTERLPRMHRLITDLSGHLYKIRIETEEPALHLWRRSIPEVQPERSPTSEQDAAPGTRCPKRLRSLLDA